MRSTAPSSGPGALPRCGPTAQPHRPATRQVEPVQPSASRRALLRGRIRAATFARPPGALAPMLFEEACTQCGDCARACPDGLLLRDGEGFPVFDPREGGCSFCGACTAACTTGALRAGQAFGWRATASDGCLSSLGTGCRICEDHCDAGAIRFRPMPGGRARPGFDPDTCTGCGACVAPCPVGAIALFRPPATLPTANLPTADLPPADLPPATLPPSTLTEPGPC